MVRCLSVSIVGICILLIRSVGFAQETGPGTGLQTFSWDFTKAPFASNQSAFLLFGNNLHMFYDIQVCTQESIPSEPSNNIFYSPNLTCLGTSGVQGATKFYVSPVVPNVLTPATNQIYSIDLKLAIPTPITKISPHGEFTQDGYLQLVLTDRVEDESLTNLLTCTSSHGQFIFSRKFVFNTYVADVADMYLTSDFLNNEHQIDIQVQCNKPIRSVSTLGGYLDSDVDYNPVLITKAAVRVGMPSSLSLLLSKSEVLPTLNPKQVDGSNKVVVTAQLNSNGDHFNKLILFKSAPLAMSGGHNHAGARPTGQFDFDLDNAFCITDSTGKCSVTFTASEFSGVEVISARVSGDPTSEVSKNLNVKIPDLVPLSGGPYTFKCAIEDCSNYKHENFYNVTLFVNAQMFFIAVAYNSIFPGATPLTVVDASLAQGGRYDFLNNWVSGHQFHRVGTDIDVRSHTIPIENRTAFRQAACLAGAFPRLENKNKPDEHFHLYFKAYTKNVLEFCERDI